MEKHYSNLQYLKKKLQKKILTRSILKRKIKK